MALSRGYCFGSFGGEGGGSCGKGIGAYEVVVVVVVTTLRTCCKGLKWGPQKKNTNLVVLIEGGKTSSGRELEAIAMPVGRRSCLYLRTNPPGVHFARSLKSQARPRSP